MTNNSWSADAIDSAVSRAAIDIRARYGIPGIQVSVSLPSEMSSRDYAFGTTTFNGTVPVTPNNLFQIGSETKSYTSALILRFAAEGKLSLDDTLDKWLTAAQIIPAWDKITIRQLLNHTSGIFNYLENPDFATISKQNGWQKQWQLEELVNLAKTEQPYFPVPGNGWHYSNTNYVLAGMILESVSGQPLQSLYSQMTAPIRLANTYFGDTVYPTSISTRLVHGYAVSRMPPYLEDVTLQNMSMATSAGAMVANTHDVALWLRALLTGSSVLPAQQLQSLTTTVNTTTGQPTLGTQPGYGLGIVHDFTTFGEEAWWHDGTTNGYMSLMVLLKNRNIVVTTIVNMNVQQVNLELTKNIVQQIKRVIRQSCVASADEKPAYC